MKGWVYIISNSLMPNIYKIGYTTKAPQYRAEEFSNIGVPESYAVEYEILVDNPRELEASVHKKLDYFNVKPEERNGEGIEWFRIDLIWAIRSIEEVAMRNHDVFYINYCFIKDNVGSRDSLLHVLRLSSILNARMGAYQREIRNLPVIENMFTG